MKKMKAKNEIYNSSGFTEEEQALIDGVELGIDYQLEVAPEDIKEYQRLLNRKREAGRKEMDNREEATGMTSLEWLKSNEERILKGIEFDKTSIKRRNDELKIVQQLIKQTEKQPQI